VVERRRQSLSVPGQVHQPDLQRRHKGQAGVR
jgi:hypothetical protein